MINYLEYLEKFLSEIDVPKFSKQNILSNLNCLYKTNNNKKNVNKIISQYKDKFLNFNKIIDDFEEFSLPIIKEKFVCDCICICLLTRRLEILYKKYGFSRKIFLETMLDIKYKINECELVKKITGIFVAFWYEDIFKMKLFSLGRLQFQVIKNYYGIPGYKRSFKLLSVHIPKSGERLDENRANESFNNAKKFFKDKFNINEPIFVCHSWLLYPENKKFLSENSNIIKFQNRFKIIDVKYDSNYEELWRIFDTEFKDLDSLSGESSLRKGYINIVKENKQIGQGIGFFKG